MKRDKQEKSKQKDNQETKAEVKQETKAEVEKERNKGLDNEGVKGRIKIKDILKKCWPYLVSILIPMVVFIVYCIITNIEPFGSKSILKADLLVQYYPFLSELREKFLNGESLFYSWNGGLGYNFFSVLSYYLISPLNLLVLIFPKDNMDIAVAIGMLIRFSLGSTLMTYYLLNSKRFTNNSNKKICAVIFGIGYSLSNYFLVYFYNIMWMDSIVLFPLVILGIERLIEEKKPKLYFFVLTYTLISNYYISFFICGFAVVWFLIYDWKNIKEFGKNIGSFLFYSLISGAVGAVVLIPSYLSIKSGAGIDKSVLNFSIFNQFGNVFVNQLPMVKETAITYDYSKAFTYCGVFALMMCIMFAFCKEISLKRRIKLVVLLLIMELSFNCSILNYLFHGLHMPNAMPNRYSFIFIFLILICAFDVSGKLKNMKYIQLAMGFICCIAFVGITVLDSDTLKDFYVYLETIMILFFIFTFIVFMKRESVKEKSFFILAAIITICELSVNGVFQLYSDTAIEIEEYYYSEETVNEIDEATIMSDTSDKIEYENFITDATVYYNKKGASLFTSTSNKDVINLYGALGLYEKINSYKYINYTKVTNSIFNMKYIVTKDNNKNDMFEQNTLLENGIVVHENKDLTAMAYMVDNKITEWDIENTNPFLVQNNFMEKATGIDKDIFREKMLSCDASCNIWGTMNETEGNYQYTVLNDLFMPKLTFTYEVTEDMELYFLINNDTTGMDNLANECDLLIDGTVEIENLETSISTKRILYAGNLKKGQTVEINIYIIGSKDQTGSINILPIEFNRQVFEEAYKELSSNVAVVKKMKSDFVKMEIDVKEDGVLFTSIPNDGGFTVYVDGEKTDIVTIGGALIGLELTQGKHEIKFVYCPLGFKIGLTVSLLGIFALIIKMSIEKKKRRQK